MVAVRPGGAAEEQVAVVNAARAEEPALALQQRPTVARPAVAVAPDVVADVATPRPTTGRFRHGPMAG